MADVQREVWLSQLLEMGFRRPLCEHAIANHASFDDAFDYILKNPHHLGCGIISLDDDDDFPFVSVRRGHVDSSSSTQLPSNTAHASAASSAAALTSNAAASSNPTAPAASNPHLQASAAASSNPPPPGVANPQLQALSSSSSNPTPPGFANPQLQASSSSSNPGYLQSVLLRPDMLKRTSVAHSSCPKKIKTFPGSSVWPSHGDASSSTAPQRDSATFSSAPLVLQYPYRQHTTEWPRWGNQRFRKTMFANTVNDDVVDLGSLSSLYKGLSSDGKGGYSLWKHLASTEYTADLFNEPELVRRLAIYGEWHYYHDHHWGTDMHVACEEVTQFRCVDRITDEKCDFSDRSERMMFSRKAAIQCIIKDLRFVPNSTESFFRAVRVPENERNHPYESISDPMITTATKLVPPNNHNDPESDQPPGFERFPLRPEQLRSLAWMRSREQNTDMFKIAYEKLFRGWIGEDRLYDRGLLFSDLHDLLSNYDRHTYVSPWGTKLDLHLTTLYSRSKRGILATNRQHHGPGNGGWGQNDSWMSEYGIDVKVEAEYPSRGGILADQLGYGKTATALGLIAFDTPYLAQQELDSIMSPADKLSYFPMQSTLVLVPSNLLCQWVEQIAKFYLPQGTTRQDEIQWRNQARRDGTDRGEFGCPKSIICFENIAKLKVMTPQQLTKYDIVVCTFRIFWSPVYESRRAYLASCRSHDKIPREYEKERKRISGTQYYVSNRTVSEEKYALHRHLARATECHYQTMESLNFPVLEQFFWRRIIYDESHEIEIMHAKVQRALTQMRTQFCWGLTGSPVLNTLRGLDIAAMIMRVDLVGWDSKHLGWMKNARFRDRAAAFVQEFIRKNTETSYAAIPMEERVIRVILQPEERALYLAQQNVNCTDKAQLIQLCSHFSGGESSKLDAMTEIDRVLEKKRKHVDERTNSLQGLLSLCSWLGKSVGIASNAPSSWLAIAENAANQITAENVKENVNQFVTQARTCDHIEKAINVNPPEASVFPFLQQSEVGFDWKQCQSVSKKNQALLSTHFNKRISVAVEGYRKALSFLTFFETTVAVLRNDSTSRSCPVCLDDNLELGRIVVTSCGHVYCLACMDTVKDAKICGVCRHTPLTAQDFSILKPKEEISSVAREKSQFEEFGSKIYTVYKKLLDIRKEDPTAKVIMFTQYVWLRCKYADVLQKFGIPFVTLKGTTAFRGNIIDSFQNDPNSNAWILLMDLTTSASGTHITAANHVIFIHPMVCDSAETAAAYEKQAIGRCQRYGQTKVVKVWRFVASNTIEEDITKLHQTKISQLAESSAVSEAEQLLPEDEENET